MGKPSSEQRKALGAFLAGKRASVQPSSSAPSSGLRRTPGLRREEVAALAGVSVSWYTWMEQGRDIQISIGTLLRIARVLQLEPVETRHLLALTQHLPAYADPSEDVSEGLVMMIQAMDPTPAYVRNARFDILAWNRSVTELFIDYGALRLHERNTIRLLFLHPYYRKLIRNWEELAHTYVLSLRAARTRASDKQPFDSLAAELSDASDEFRAWWSEVGVTAFSEGLKQLRHPSLGDVDYAYVTMTPENQPNLSVVVYVPLTSARDPSS